MISSFEIDLGQDYESWYRDMNFDSQDLSSRQSFWPWTAAVKLAVF